MVVAAEDDRVLRLDGRQGAGQAVAGGGEAVPGVGPVARLGPVCAAETQARHDQVLAQDVPACLGLRQVVVEPAFLLEA
ncbi:hypothetical protein D3C80_1222100 [compost metagenome]